MSRALTAHLGVLNNYAGNILEQLIRLDLEHTKSSVKNKYL